MSVRVSAWAAAGVLALSLVLGLTAGPCAAPDSLPGLPGWIKSPNAFSLAGEQDGLEAGVRPVPVPPRRNVVEISAPGVLDRPDTVYRLTKDVVADGTAFQIVKSSITLDLNGHTVTYGQKDVPGDSYGVHFTGAWHHDDVAVYNGRIVQGAAAGSGALGDKWGSPYGSRVNPIQGMSLNGAVFAGLDIVYNGKDSSGLFIKGAKLQVFFNTIDDRGHGVTNRHAGLAAIEGSSKGMKIHHNRIVRARHNGIRAGAGSEVYNNSVFIDSENTNSAAIAAGGRVYNNRIVARGEHPLGFYIAGNLIGDGVVCSGNYVDVQTTRMSQEYGSAGADCLRMQWGNNVEVKDNIFIVRATENYQNTGLRSWGRALMVSISEEGLAADYHDNLIVALSSDGKGKAAGIGVVANNKSHKLVFRRNTIVSNWSNVLLADQYGHADGFAVFKDNVFVGVPSPTYHTVRSEYSSIPSTAEFISNRMEGAASLDDIHLEFSGTGLKEIAVGWHLGLEVVDASGRPVGGARVEITDSRGGQAFSGETGRDGKVLADVHEYVLTNRRESRTEKALRVVIGAAGEGNRVELTPHTVKVTANGRTTTQKVDVSADKTLRIQL